MPQRFDSPTPDQRFRELAAILATGLLRLARPVVPQHSEAQPPSKTVEESDVNQLAVAGEKSVTGHAG